MEELSIEEKAKAYDEAIERAKALLSYKEVRQEDMEYLFPELKESEEEKVRKALIELVKYAKGNCLELLHKPFNVVSMDAMLAWLEKHDANKEYVFRPLADTMIENAVEQALEQGDVVLAFNGFYTPVKGKTSEEILTEYDNWIEKQCEQPTDKVEPKFKVGDWIVTDDSYGNIVRHVDEIISNIIEEIYCVSDEYGLTYNISFDREHKWHKWTINDASDGDILVNGSNIFIFHFINNTRLMGYCHVNMDDGRFYDDLGKNECFCTIDAEVTPATKEQRELLFEKMKQVGYEWDVEKKELKKIEVTSKESEDEGIRKALIEYFGEQYAMSDWNGVYGYQVLAWLEKQSEKKSADEVLKIRQELYQSGYNDGYKHGQEDIANKEYVFRPVAGTEIENAVEQALKQGDVVLEFNGFYTSVKGKTSKEILTEYDHWLEKQGEPNPYSGVSFKYNGHIWGMCARDNGVDILLDKQLYKHIDKQGKNFDAEGVLEWLGNNPATFGARWCKTENIIEQFKKDFGLL